MATRLDKPLKREVRVDGRPYVLTIDPAKSDEAAK